MNKAVFIISVRYDTTSWSYTTLTGTPPTSPKTPTIPVPSTVLQTTSTTPYILPETTPTPAAPTVPSTTPNTSPETTSTPAPSKIPTTTANTSPKTTSTPVQTTESQGSAVQENKSSGLTQDIIIITGVCVSLIGMVIICIVIGVMVKICKTKVHVASTSSF